MRNRRKLFVLLAALMAVVGALLWFTSAKEPTYDGRTLYEWVTLYSTARLRNSINPPPEPADALRHIGTKALPWLLAWIDYEPGLRNKVAQAAEKKLPKQIGRVVVVALLMGDRAYRAYQAKEAFAALGPIAAPAIPQLAQMASLTNASVKADAALVALAYIGPEALPTLVKVLSSPAHADRMWQFDVIDPMGTNASPLVPLLLQRLQNTNRDVAFQSVLILCQTKLDPDLIVPAMITNLQAPRLEVRQLAPLILGAYGERARPALPALSNALSDPNPNVRGNAHTAIWKITTAPGTNAPAQ